ncbi:MAG TPA: FmdE family protein [Anaerolineales bacterium]|nr:FmdE family protein [Anaerolineales bacterium]
MSELQTYLQKSAARRSRLCPRQVLGVRFSLAGLSALGLTPPPERDRLLVISETDGCFVGAVEVVTGAGVDRHSLRIEDFGKTAAVFVDRQSGVAVRVSPAPGLRARAANYAPPGEKRHYFIQLHAYQVMPDSELIILQPVRLTPPLATLLGRPGVRTNCEHCGEEIINQREVMRAGQTLCKACAGLAYYLHTTQPPEA